MELHNHPGVTAPNRHLIVFHPLTGREPKITPARLAGYYRQHKQEFVIEEQRPVRVAHTETEAAAIKLKNELTSGALTVAQANMEGLAYARRAKLTGEQPLLRAIYSAKLGRFTGPIKDGHVYFIFKLTGIIPAREQTFAEVRPAVEKQLAEEQRRQALAEFVTSWRAKWIPQTDCQPGYVVQQCRQYKGPNESRQEDPFAAI